MVMGSCLLMPGPWLRGYENNLFAFLFCAIRKGRSVSRWCWLFTCDVLPGKIKCRVTSTLSSSLQECFQHTPFKVQSSTGCDFALLHHTFLQWSRRRKGESCPGLVCPSGEALTRPGPLSWPAPSHEAQYKGWWPSGLPTARLWGDAEHFSSCFAWLASPHRLAGSVEAGWTELSYLLFTLPSICKAVSESLMGLFDSVWFNERSSELQAMLWVLPLALGKSIIINLRSAFFTQYVFLWACSSMRISFKRQSHS